VTTGLGSGMGFAAASPMIGLATDAAAMKVRAVRATPSKIPKRASCGLYKNSGSGEMRLME